MITRTAAWFLSCSLSAAALRADVPLEEAIDFPGFNATYLGTWRGLSGTGHDGVDCLSSPMMSQSFGTPSARITFQASIPGMALDGTFWWRKNSSDGIMAFAPGYRHWTDGLRWQPRQSGVWLPVRFHFDRPSSVYWAVDKVDGLPVPADTGQIDQFTRSYGPLDSFDHALDTDEPASGSWNGSPHWDGRWVSFGEGIAQAVTESSAAGGDALEVLPDPLISGIQTVTLTRLIGPGTHLVFRARNGSGATLSGEAGRVGSFITTEPMPIALPGLKSEWTEHAVALPVFEESLWRELRLTVTLPAGDPAAFVRLDSFSLQSSTDINAALETTGLSWTAGGDSLLEPASVLSDGADGLRQWIPDGTNLNTSWVETVVTGPVTVLCSGRDGWHQLLVDGALIDERQIPYDWSSNGQNRRQTMQALLPPGPHTVRWQVSGWSGVVGQLLSFKVVPPAAPGAAAAYLAAQSPDRTWMLSGAPPELLYQLEEGVASTRGIVLMPAAGGTGSSWLQTVATGSADVSVRWDASTGSECRVDGRRAAGPVTPLPYLRSITPTVLHLPAGAHVIRWVGGNAPSPWSDFSITESSGVPALLDAWALPGQQPLLWVTQASPSNYSRGWLPDTDRWNTRLLPAETGPLLGGADRTYGRFTVTGPATLFLKVRQEAFEDFYVRISGVKHSLSSPGYDKEWQAHAVPVPSGEHEITLAADYDDLGIEDSYVYVDKLQLLDHESFLAWADDSPLALRDTHPELDPDGDGLSNLVEFAFGTDPAAISGFTLTTAQSSTGSLLLQLPSLPYDAAGLSWEVQTSADLQTWTTAATASPAAAGAAGPSVILPSTVRQFVRVNAVLQ